MAKQALAEIDRMTDSRPARILARSLFRDMRGSGYGNQQILALATELIDLVTRDMRGEGDADVRPESPLQIVHPD